MYVTFAYAYAIFSYFQCWSNSQEEIAIFWTIMSTNSLLNNSFTFTQVYGILNDLFVFCFHNNTERFAFIPLFYPILEY